MLPYQTAERIATLEKIIGQIEQFMGDEAQYDDLTLLLVDGG